MTEFLNDWIKTHFQDNTESILNNTKNYSINNYYFSLFSMLLPYISYKNKFHYQTGFQVIRNFVLGTRNSLTENITVSISREKCIVLSSQTLYIIVLF